MQRPAAITNQTKKIYSVLIVSEEPGLGEVLTAALTGPQRSIEVRDTPRAAGEFLQQNPVDLIFVDPRLPDHAAQALVEMVHRQFGGLPVLTCSGDGPERPSGPTVATRVRWSWQQQANFGERLAMANTNIAPE